MNRATQPMVLLDKPVPVRLKSYPVRLSIPRPVSLLSLGSAAANKCGLEGKPPEAYSLLRPPAFQLGSSCLSEVPGIAGQALQFNLLTTDRVTDGFHAIRSFSAHTHFFRPVDSLAAASI